MPATITEAATWLRDGRTTASAMVEECLARAHGAQDTIGAFISLCDDAAMAAAQRADADLKRGADHGPLHGIPIGIKDIIATIDAPTTANSRLLAAGSGSDRDATSVWRLRSVGAISIGKLGLHEFGNGWPDPSTGFRTVRNPWDLTRTPGGSSTGAGAALAGGLILGGLGTDSAGSIRGPASYCGVSGIKPTDGLVSTYGCIPLSATLDTVGPLARTAMDCALMLQAIAGYDSADPSSVDAAVPDMIAMCDGSLTGVRIGIPRDYFFDLANIDADIADAIAVALDNLASAGARVIDVGLPFAEQACAATKVILWSEAFACHEENLRTRSELYGKYTRRMLQLGALFTASDYVHAQRLRKMVTAAWEAVMEPVDVMIVPTTPSAPPKFDGYDPDAWIGSPNLVGMFNLTGLPAMSIPCGFSRLGLPIGMQIVGKRFGEPVIFKVGDAYQRITDWHTRNPPPPTS